MSDVLGAIMASARRSAETRARSTPRADLDRQAAAAAPDAARFRNQLRVSGVRIIAECKRRSPSRGILRHAYDPAAIAVSYANAGAAAISVLTEPTFFDGSLDHLRAVRAAVSLPLLRKDFIATEFQIVEARAAGADAVLLIVAALDDVELARLIGIAEACGLAALVEVHTGEDLRRALGAGARVVGINSRDLRTLAVDTGVFDALILGLPSDVAAVAESGLQSAGEIRRLRDAGFDAFLMGERFMTALNPGAALDDVRRAAMDGEAAS